MFSTIGLQFYTLTYIYSAQFRNASRLMYVSYYYENLSYYYYYYILLFWQHV